MMTPCQKENLSRKRFASGDSSVKHADVGTGLDQLAQRDTEPLASMVEKIFMRTARHGCSPTSDLLMGLSSCTHVTTVRASIHRIWHLGRYHRISKTWRVNSARAPIYRLPTCAQFAHLQTRIERLRPDTDSRATKRSEKSSAGEYSVTWGEA